MKIYLVGGTVRDELLGLPVKEKDYVVVGATVEEMLRQGYRPVGKDFPVFLHPKTNEEYALARVERKVRPGYTGFDFNASTHVTLEDDLLRRDLTINAIAKTPEGEIIDPFHGQRDLEKKILRHVSPAFIEDPVRILRVARFAARFAHLGFVVAEETNTLMQKMVASGEINALVPERVFKEWDKALTEEHPEVFFHVLDACDALSVLFPEIKKHDAGVQSLAVVSPLLQNSAARFAALLHDKTAVDIQRLCTHYRVPNDYRELALLVATYLPMYRTGEKLSAEELVTLFEKTDAFRRADRFALFLATSAALVPGHLDDFFIARYAAAKQVDVASLIALGYTGSALPAKIREERIKNISAL